MMKRNRLLAVALVAACANGAMAMDEAGFAFTGYSRGGPVFNHSDGAKGGLSLGGELQKYCLVNEGGNGIEVSGFSFEPEAKFWTGRQHEVWS
jgi:maltoporin